MHYLSAENLSKAYGDKPLFDEITFHLSEGDKVALIALNGSGKSTLLNIISGLEVPDSGQVQINKEVNVVLLPQKPKIQEECTVIENIFNHDHPTINALKNYELLQAAPEENTPAINEAIQEMNDQNAWDYEAKIKQILSRLEISHYYQKAGALSGGQKKRIALAKVLIDMNFEHRHTLIILDEPTNHLDVAMVEWLENYLSKAKVTLLLVTHDRYFLDAVCNKILELSHRKIYTHDGNYENYLSDKANRMEVAESNIEKAKNKYRTELEWMRRQPRARGTKSKKRQEEFYKWEEKAKQNTNKPDFQLEVKMTRLGGKVVNLKKLYKSYGDKVILKGFDYNFKKGERIGIIGANGVGKSTLINILLQNEKPDSGKIDIGETIVFGNFSQEGLTYKEDVRVIEYVKELAEYFPLADGTKISAAQFLERFLFPRDKQYTFLSKLSGGELKRLQLLSVLFKNPNFLVLDEPTNDLDLPTLQVLEEFLQRFPGCVVIVSHDRYFMDKVIDHLLVFEGNGQIKDFPGNYGQYRQQKIRQQQKAKTIPRPKQKLQTNTEKPQKKERQLSYKEKREMIQLETDIQALNQEKDQLEKALNSGELGFEALEEKGKRITAITNELEKKEWRWLELSELPES